MSTSPATPARFPVELEILFKPAARQWLLNRAFAAVGNWHAAEDLVQETMLRIVRTADRYDPSLSPVTWALYRLRGAICRIARRHQNQPKREPLLAMGSACNEDDSLRLVDVADEADHLRVILRRCAEWPQCVERHVEGEAHAEIGRSLGVNESTSIRRARAAVERVRAVLRNRDRAAGVALL